MKIFVTIVVLAVTLLGANLLHAQETGTALIPSSPASLPSLESYSDAQLEQMMSELAAIPLIWPTNLPDNGAGVGYWSLAHPNWPPLPSPFGIPSWEVSSNFLLLDDIDYPETVSANNDIRATGMFSPMDSGGGGFSPSFSFQTNGLLWLQITNVAGGTVYANLNNATDQVYSIWSTTNLTIPFANWQVETEVWPTDTNTMPFTVETMNRQMLFLRAEDWTGITTDGNQTPSWWFWLYFQTVDLSDTNLDSSGQHTLLYDYTNGVDPDTLTFNSINVTNTYCNVNPVPAQISVTGIPYYIAILVDDNNLNDAVWDTYNSSNITVNIGSVEGPHDVLIGLRGHADAPSDAMWLGTELNLNLASPVLAITNPVVSTVTTPIVQLQGYSSEHLTSITYDVANSAGTVTNQPALVLDQFYDTNLLEYTTNYFQCFDVPLVTGPNTVKLHATDFAGNVTTTNFTFDYSSPTNPPVVQLNWPQNGAQISGSNFTWRGCVSDPTAQVVAQVVNTNGVTNSVTGQVGRSGDFWVYGLPLSAGTNYLSLTATDAAGNTSTTNIVVTQSSLILTIMSASFGQPVQGTISDWTNYTVWVNGVIATNNGDGTWTAYPSITLDTTVVQARAIPNSDNDEYGGGQ